MIVSTWSFIWGLCALFFALGSLVTIVYVRYHEKRYGGYYNETDE